MGQIPNGTPTQYGTFLTHPPAIRMTLLAAVPNIPTFPQTGVAATDECAPTNLRTTQNQKTRATREGAGLIILLFPVLPARKMNVLTKLWDLIPFVCYRTAEGKGLC
jgi:hypothetical protein